ncbi:MAG: radical SAM protein [Lachnospiraceae bacterium]|nr:radical SAM protein [Lachnospiraceae bacterium]
MIDANEIIRGGTGYKNYGSLPEEIEKTSPDYSIYPSVDYAIGFLTRGCIRRCPWCIVPTKEGQIRPASAWEEIKRPDSDRIIFMDNNVLASPHGLQQIESMGGQKVWVDFNQGLDARLVTPETAALLARLRWIRFVRLSCDTAEMLPVIEQAVAYMKEAGIAKSRFWAYLLVQDVEDAKNRVTVLHRMGVEPFAQWVNKKSVFHSCTWEEFKKQ